MPSTRIATGVWVHGQEASIIEAVQNALTSALVLPEWDRDVVLDCYGSDQRTVPSGCSERFTRIEVILFSGRSNDTKRHLYKVLVDNLAAVGVPEGEIKIVLIEVARENWGIRGGVPASEVDLGFKVDR